MIIIRGGDGCISIVTVVVVLSVTVSFISYTSLLTLAQFPVSGL